MALSENIGDLASGQASRLASGPGRAIKGWPAFPVTLYFVLILLPLEFDLGPLFMTGIRALLLVLTIPMCLKLFTGQLGRVLATDILFLLFAIWNIFALAVKSPDQALSFGGSVALEAFGGYMLARTYVRTAADFVATCRMLFWIIGLTLPFAFYESQTGVAPIPVLIEKLPFFYSVSDFFNEAAGRRMGLERAQVIFSHPIHYGLFCSTAISLAFVGFKGTFTPQTRWFVAGMAVVGVIFSVSSGAILPMIVQFGLILWAWAMNPVHRRWGILIGLVATAYVIVDMISNRSPIAVFLERATFSPHNAYWRMLIFEWGMKNVWANPYLGLGMNTWVRPWFMHSGSMDNYWLVVAVRYGIPGFLLLAAGYALVIWHVARRNLDADPLLWQLRRAWVFTLVGLVLTLCTVDVWATAMSYVFFLFGAGVWFLSANPQRPEDPGEKAVETRRRPAAFTRQTGQGKRDVPPPAFTRFGPRNGA